MSLADERHFVYGTSEAIRDSTFPGATRDDAAAVYAAVILHGWAIDWQTYNLALIENWSESGLRYIKRRAWKLAQP